MDGLFGDKSPALSESPIEESLFGLWIGLPELLLASNTERSPSLLILEYEDVRDNDVSFSTSTLLSIAGTCGGTTIRGTKGATVEGNLLASV